MIHAHRISMRGVSVNVTQGEPPSRFACVGGQHPHTVQQKVTYTINSTTPVTTIHMVIASPDKQMSRSGHHPPLPSPPPKK